MKNKLFISNRKETQEELNILYKELFNWNANKVKINLFFDLIKEANNFCPSERCKNKKCVLETSCGNLDSEIMFIAEAPGRNGAERTKIPIYGDPSGDNFENILNKASLGKINRKDVFITNAFLWNPTDENGNNDKPTEEEINKSIYFLKRQIEIVDPSLIIVLGKTAYNTLGKISELPEECFSIKNMIGKVYNWNKKYFISILYHPSPRVVGVYRTIEQMVCDLKKIFKEYIRIKKDVNFKI